MVMTTAKQRKRYRLHQKIKNHFKYDAQGHTVYVPYDFAKKTIRRTLKTI